MTKFLFKLGVILLLAGLVGFATYKLTDRAAVVDITNEIQGIVAPWFDPFTAKFLTDGGKEGIHAWHSSLNPQYPVPLSIQFKRAVSLKRIGFQCQYGNIGLLDRAPKTVQIYAGEDSEHLQKFGGILTLDFSSSGQWIFRDLPSGKKHVYYRIDILSNRGNVTYLTVQELKFFGRD